MCHTHTQFQRRSGLPPSPWWLNDPCIFIYTPQQGRPRLTLAPQNAWYLQGPILGPSFNSFYVLLKQPCCLCVPPCKLATQQILWSQLGILLLKAHLRMPVPVCTKKGQKCCSEALPACLSLFGPKRKLEGIDTRLSSRTTFHSHIPIFSCQPPVVG